MHSYLNKKRTAQTAKSKKLLYLKEAIGIETVRTHDRHRLMAHMRQTMYHCQSDKEVMLNRIYLEIPAS